MNLLDLLRGARQNPTMRNQMSGPMVSPDFQIPRAELLGAENEESPDQPSDLSLEDLIAALGGLDTAGPEPPMSSPIPSATRVRNAVLKRPSSMAMTPSERALTTRQSAENFSPSLRRPAAPAPAMPSGQNLLQREMADPRTRQTVDSAQALVNALGGGGALLGLLGLGATAGAPAGAGAALAGLGRMAPRAAQAMPRMAPRMGTFGRNMRVQDVMRTPPPPTMGGGPYNPAVAQLLKLLQGSR